VIEVMTPADWPQVREIYEQGIASGNATFETTSPGWEQWDASHLPSPRLVYRGASASGRPQGGGDEDRQPASLPLPSGTILGWAALSPVSKRHVYRGVAEVSVYVRDSARGRGVGHALLARLVEESERHGIWTLQASIFPENEASVAIHHRCGFRIVGTRERIARQYGRWRDTVIMERRAAPDEV
jgi:L-amino acid N-acyltransferase YncA